MKNIAIRVIRATPFYHPIRIWSAKWRRAREVVAWERSGRPAPVPHAVKQMALLSFAQEYQLRVFVETGTYFGDMVAAMTDHFDEIYSIELSKEYYERARKRFKGLRHVHLVRGDSGKELENIARQISQPALFWLDAHYSGGSTARGNNDTPVFEELHAVLSSKGACGVIIIDDARFFGRDPNYPSIDQLRDFVASIRPDLDFIVENDSVRITPGR